MSVDEMPEAPCCADPDACPCDRRAEEERFRQEFAFVLQRVPMMVEALEQIAASGPPTLSGHLHAIERAKSVLREIP